MTPEWKRIKVLRSELDNNMEQKQALTDAIKETREELDAVLESGESDEDWRELHGVWIRLDCAEMRRRQVSSKISQLRRRLDLLVRTGEDPDETEPSTESWMQVL